MSQEQILLVDNEPEHLEPLQEFFEGEGYRVLLATDPTEARRIMENEPVNLAVIDLRLINNEDEKDISGLTLAKQVKSDIPKIIWTAFPTVQAVREALGPRIDGLPPVVAFIPKEEGVESLLAAVRLALMQINPRVENKMLKAFGVGAPVALHHRIQEVGPSEAGRRFSQSFQDASDELTEHRERESRHASQLHVAGLIASAVGILLIFVAGALFLKGSVGAAVFSSLASVVANVVRVLFSIREDAAHKRISASYEELGDVNRLGNLLAVCEALESPAERDAYRKKIIDHIIGLNWVVGPSRKAP
jgi:CheY-like chemotaxis protein